MSRAVYLIGPPGVGKSTLMRALESEYVPGESHRVWGKSLMWLTPLFDDHGCVGVELGRHREAFSGTDALGMGVMPHALAWLATPRLPSLILGEGARLGTAMFLRELSDRADLTVVHMTASPDALAARRALRGSRQDPTWMRGAGTRAANAASRLEKDGVRVVHLDATEASPTDLRDQIMEHT